MSVAGCCLLAVGCPRWSFRDYWNY